MDLSLPNTATLAAAAQSSLAKKHFEALVQYLTTSLPGTLGQVIGLLEALAFLAFRIADGERPKEDIGHIWTGIEGVIALLNAADAEYNEVEPSISGARDELNAQDAAAGRVSPDTLQTILAVLSGGHPDIESVREAGHELRRLADSNPDFKPALHLFLQALTQHGWHPQWETIPNNAPYLTLYKPAARS